jgi:thiol-disulfide isomerase/thioredoxin
MKPNLFVAAQVVFFAGVPGKARADLVGEVRGLAKSGEADTARKLIERNRAERGLTPEVLEAMSWVARGELMHGHFESARHEAGEVDDLCVKTLASRALDAEPHLPIALGAAIEVEAQALAAQDDRSEAIQRLQDALAKYGKTSIANRILKNLNLLTLVGKVPPALDEETHLGGKSPPLSALKGRAAVLFFWAHWCGDCRNEGPVLARILSEYRLKGLELIAPTQTYGTVAGGVEAPRDVELRHIEDIRQHRFDVVPDMSVPVSSASFRSYGVSTTPTWVVVNRKGLVTLYHPGFMTFDELNPTIEAALR